MSFPCTDFSGVGCGCSPLELTEQVNVTCIDIVVDEVKVNVATCSIKLKVGIVG